LRGPKASDTELPVAARQQRYLFSVRWVLGCSADFQSAVSPNCIRQDAKWSPQVALSESSQRATLRYSRDTPNTILLGHGAQHTLQARATWPGSLSLAFRAWSRL